MKPRVWLVLSVFVFVFVFQANGTDSEKKHADIKIAGTGLKILLKKEVPYTIKELQEIFHKRNDELEHYYKNKQFEKIGEYYGQAGVVTTYDGKACEGIEKISGYFARLYDKGVKEIDFQTDYLYIHYRPGFLNKEKPDPNALTYVLYEIILLNYDLEGGSNHTEPSMAYEFHPWKTWPRE